MWSNTFWHRLTLACAATSNIFSSERSKMFSSFQVMISQRSHSDPKYSQIPISLPISINPTFFSHLIARCFSLGRQATTRLLPPKECFQTWMTHTHIQIFYDMLHNYILNTRWCYSEAWFMVQALSISVLYYLNSSPCKPASICRKDQLKTCDTC